jgi:hypothetical protein
MEALLLESDSEVERVINTPIPLPLEESFDAIPQIETIFEESSAEDEPTLEEPATFAEVVEVPVHEPEAIPDLESVPNEETATVFAFTGAKIPSTTFAVTAHPVEQPVIPMLADEKMTAHSDSSDDESGEFPISIERIIPQSMKPVPLMSSEIRSVDEKYTFSIMSNARKPEEPSVTPPAKGKFSFRTLPFETDQDVVEETIKDTPVPMQELEMTPEFEEISFAKETRMYTALLGSDTKSEKHANELEEIVPRRYQRPEIHESCVDTILNNALPGLTDAPNTANELSEQTVNKYSIVDSEMAIPMTVATRSTQNDSTTVRARSIDPERSVVVDVTSEDSVETKPVGFQPEEVSVETASFGDSRLDAIVVSATERTEDKRYKETREESSEDFMVTRTNVEPVIVSVQPCVGDAHTDAIVMQPVMPTEADTRFTTYSSSGEEESDEFPISIEQIIPHYVKPVDMMSPETESVADDEFTFSIMSNARKPEEPQPKRNTKSVLTVSRPSDEFDLGTILIETLPVEAEQVFEDIVQDAPLLMQELESTPEFEEMAMPEEIPRYAASLGSDTESERQGNEIEEMKPTRYQQPTMGEFRVNSILLHAQESETEPTYLSAVSQEESLTPVAPIEMEEETTTAKLLKIDTTETSDVYLKAKSDVETSPDRYTTAQDNVDYTLLSSTTLDPEMPLSSIQKVEKKSR